MIEYSKTSKDEIFKSGNDVGNNCILMRNIAMSDKLMHTVECAFKILILGIWTVIMIGLFVVCTVRTVDMGEFDGYFLHDSPILQFAFIAAVYVMMSVMCLLTKKYMPDNICKWFAKNKNCIGAVVGAGVSLFLIWWISITHYEPVSDQMHCLLHAKELLNGNNHAWTAGEYMSVYPFQNGLVFFDMLLILLFGDNAYIAFQYVNVVFFIVSVIAIHKTCGYMFGKEKGLAVWLVLLVFYPFEIYVIYCYGTMIGFSLATLAVMFLFTYFNNRKMRYLVLCAGFITLSIIIKMNYAIIFVGIILYLIYDMIIGYDAAIKSMAKNIKKGAIGLIIVIAIYVTALKFFNVVFDNVIGYHNDGIPKIAWVAMGTHDDETKPGWFDGYAEYVYKKNGMDKEKTIQECMEHIGDRIVILIDEKRLIKFYYRKITSQWEDPTWRCFDIQYIKSNTFDSPIKDTIKHESNRVYREILNICQTLIYFGILLYIFMKWKNFKSLNIYELFNAVLMIGAFIFWTFWEANSSYVLPYYYLVIPYSVVGWKCVVVKTVDKLISFKICVNKVF